MTGPPSGVRRVRFGVEVPHRPELLGPMATRAEALEKLGDLVAESDFTKATQTVELLLTFLLSKHVVGRERAERLSHLAKTASTGGADPFEDEAQDEDDADDEPIN